MLDQVFFIFYHKHYSLSLCCRGIPIEDKVGNIGQYDIIIGYNGQEGMLLLPVCELAYQKTLQLIYGPMYTEDMSLRAYKFCLNLELGSMLKLTKSIDGSTLKSLTSYLIRHYEVDSPNALVKMPTLQRFVDVTGEQKLCDSVLL